ncbi:MAG: hypothetical protein U1E27_05985 [Kiritimatiellia bacterium]|nr:hypothetical protein [Kiritimatiellia bacterium]
MIQSWFETQMGWPGMKLPELSAEAETLSPADGDVSGQVVGHSITGATAGEWRSFGSGAAPPGRVRFLLK